MPSGRMKSAVVAVACFAGGWAGAELVGRHPAMAQPQASLPTLERAIHALMYGVATVAVDAEAAAMRIAEQGDRQADLERRVAALEAQIKR